MEKVTVHTDGAVTWDYIERPYLNLFFFLIVILATPLAKTFADSLICSTRAVQQAEERKERQNQQKTYKLSKKHNKNKNVREQVFIRLLNT